MTHDSNPLRSTPLLVIQSTIAQDLASESARNENKIVRWFHARYPSGVGSHFDSRSNVVPWCCILTQGDTQPVTASWSVMMVKPLPLATINMARATYATEQPFKQTALSGTIVVRYRATTNDVTHGGGESCSTGIVGFVHARVWTGNWCFATEQAVSHAEQASHWTHAASESIELKQRHFANILCHRNRGESYWCIIYIEHTMWVPSILYYDSCKWTPNSGLTSIRLGQARLTITTSHDHDRHYYD